MLPAWPNPLGPPRPGPPNARIALIARYGPGFRWKQAHTSPLRAYLDSGLPRLPLGSMWRCAYAILPA